MRSHRARWRPLAVVALAAVSLGVAAPPASLAGPTSPTGTFANGTVLPSGRLVTPAGTTANLGDFPLGVAISPDGRLAVAINSGQGYGLNNGHGSYSTDRRQGAPCPYRDNLPSTTALKRTSGDPATRAPDESLSVVNLRTGRVSTVTAVPTSYDATPGAKDRFNFFYVGVTFSPDGRHLYAAGGGNDAVYDFPVRRDVVASRPARTIILPAATRGVPGVPTTDPNQFTGQLSGFTKGLAVTPNGRYLLVTHELNDTLDIVDTRAQTVTQQIPFAAPVPAGGAYPYGVAVSRDGGTAYVALQGLGQLAVVKLSGGQGTLGPNVSVGDHPTAVALSPDGTRLYVTNADDDTLSVLTVDPATGTPTPAATILLHALDGEQLGSTPNAVAVSPDNQFVYVTLAGDDAVAVVGAPAALTGATARAAASSPPAAQLKLLGLVPTGWYPSAVATSPDGSRLYAVSAKGLGSRYPEQGRGGDTRTSFEYDGNNMPGLLQGVALPRKPSDLAATLSAGTAQVVQDIQFAGTAAGRSSHNPVPAAPYVATLGSALPMTAPIQHVIEIVRENRTFDQQLGDLAADEGRNQPGTDTVDANPAYAIFGREVTPNVHALVGDPSPGTSNPAYATADNFYSDGEASIQGHYWTVGANVNDYVEKTWRQYYSPRNHIQDTLSTVSEPHNCSIFQSAIKRQTATGGTFTYRDYGELAGISNPSISAPGTPPFGGPAAGVPATCQALSPLDFDPLGGTLTTSTITQPTELVGTNGNLVKDNREDAYQFLQDNGLNPDGSRIITSTSTLRNFSYLIMGGDHTAGLASDTPRARVAQNDAGIGLIAQALSHSSYWSSTAIFVMEDDSQDGLDHRDGHRNLLYVISPYAKHAGPDGKPGYIAHRHYSQASVLKTIDLLMGFPYLSAYDQNAPALYDLFQDKDAPAQLDQTDLAPYTLQPAPSFINETGAQYARANPAMADVLRAETKRLDLSGIDRAGPELEIINWQMAHPNSAVPAQLLQARRAWAATHGGAKDGD